MTKPSKKTQRKLERRLKGYAEIMANPKIKANPEAYRRPGSRNQHKR